MSMREVVSKGIVDSTWSVVHNRWQEASRREVNYMIPN